VTISYTNRFGRTYYLHEGVTGRDRLPYYFAGKKYPNVLDTLPDGYEIYETPNGQVFLRLISEKIIIIDEEVELLRALVFASPQLRWYRVEPKDNLLLLLQPVQEIPILTKVVDVMVAEEGKCREECFQKLLTYQPFWRFILKNYEERLFVSERFKEGERGGCWVRVAEENKLHSLLPELSDRINLS